MAQIAASTSGDTGATNVTSLEATVPAGGSDGNLLIFVVVTTGTAAGITMPAGWTAVLDYQGVSTWYVMVLTRPAASEPASYTVTTTSARSTWSMHRITDSPGFPDTSDYRTNEPGIQNVVAPSIIMNGTSLHLLVYAASLDDSDTATWTSPADYTEATDNTTTGVSGNNATHAVTSKSVPAGATFEQTAVMSILSTGARLAISIGILDNEQPGTSQVVALVL